MAIFYQLNKDTCIPVPGKERRSRLCINSSLLRHNAPIKPASLHGLDWVQFQFCVAFTASAQLARNSSYCFLWDYINITAVKYCFHSKIKVGVFQFFSFFFPVCRVPISFGKYYVTHHCKTADATHTHTSAYHTLLLHLLWLNAIVLELYWNKSRNNDELCEWVCAVAAAAARHWSQLRLSFAHLGLNLRPLLMERFLVPTGSFYVTSLCVLWIFFETFSLASISRVCRPSVKGPVLLMHA